MEGGRFRRPGRGTVRQGRIRNSKAPAVAAAAVGSTTNTVVDDVVVVVVNSYCKKKEDIHIGVGPGIGDWIVASTGGSFRSAAAKDRDPILDDDRVVARIAAVRKLADPVDETGGVDSKLDLAGRIGDWAVEEGKVRGVGVGSVVQVLPTARPVEVIGLHRLAETVHVHRRQL